MELNDQTSKVLLRDDAIPPYKQLVLHIDFQRVDAKTKLHMKVPVHYSGSEESAAVKIDKCMVNPLVTELDVACMPSDLPEFIAVDLSGLKKGFSAPQGHQAAQGVSAVTRGSQNNPTLVAVVPPAVEIEAPAADAAAAAPARGKGKGKK